MSEKNWERFPSPLGEMGVIDLPSEVFTNKDVKRVSVPSRGNGVIDCVGLRR